MVGFELHHGKMRASIYGAKGARFGPILGLGVGFFLEI
jgi:hypothetical protein